MIRIKDFCCCWTICWALQPTIDWVRLGLTYNNNVTWSISTWLSESETTQALRVMTQKCLLCSIGNYDNSNNNNDNITLKIMQWPENLKRYFLTSEYVHVVCCRRILSYDYIGQNNDVFCYRLQQMCCIANEVVNLINILFMILMLSWVWVYF